MDVHIIRHRPRHFRYTLSRRWEPERECSHCPDGMPHAAARCPDCESVMLYRGIGRLRSGKIVHHFECVHSPHEVHSVSIIIAEQQHS